MELTLAERKALTKTIASRYARSDRAGKGHLFSWPIMESRRRT
jgi:hypothetical protein